MAELTRYQIESARSAFWKSMGCSDASAMSGNKFADGLRAAAPFLQMPWNEPMEYECEIVKGCCSALELVRGFVNLRNAALLPKPPIGDAAINVIARTRGCTFTPEDRDAIIDAVRKCTDNNYAVKK